MGYTVQTNVSFERNSTAGTANREAREGLPRLRDSIRTQPVLFKGTGDFLKTLRERVNNHFAGKKRRDDPRLYRKASIIAVWFVGSYVLLLMAQSAWIQIALCLSYAFAACAVGFNIFHDANHGSFSSNQRVNLLLSWITATVLGAGRYFWWYKHNVLHHHFTNIFEWDDDIETRGFLRMSPRQPWKPRYKNQHRFFVLIYSMNTFEWFFVKDYVQYYKSRINPYQPVPAMSRAEKLEFWGSKAIYYALFVLLPFAFLPAWRVLLGLILFHLTLSLLLTFIFQLAHAIEKSDFPVPNGNPATIFEEWAAHELRTTVNFAPNNRLLSWFAGGLNFQIEHHLFPQISHTHYPDISQIVRRTAAEFSLPYNLYDTYLGTVQAHYRILRKLGKPPSVSKVAESEV
jgi:linoleoyl-CoA desaturase